MGSNDERHLHLDDDQQVTIPLLPDIDVKYIYYILHLLKKMTIYLFLFQDLHSADYECLRIEINRGKSRPTVICCAYRAPDIDFANFISNLNIRMESIDLDKCDFFLLGDLNAKTHSKNKRDKQELLSLALMLDLKQLITEATRVTQTSRTLLDVILVSNEHRITDSGVVPVPLSDHYLVYCILKTGVAKAPPKTIEYRSYKNFDINSFIADLEDVPWHLIENEDDIDDAVLLWNKLFSDIADCHAPVKRKRIRGVPLPWLTNKINQAMKDRDFYHRKVRDSSKFWKAINDASSRNAKSTIPQCIVSEGIQHTTTASIATAMNTHFASIGKALADKISSIFTVSNYSNVNENSFMLREVDVNCVLDLLLSLKTNKAIGLDNISERLLK